VKRALLAASAAGVILSSGCARNAFLELTIVLPKNSDASGPRYAVTQVLSGDIAFDIQWGSDNTIAPVLLDKDKTQTQTLSIEGNTDNETTQLRVKVTFCKEPSCVGVGDDKAPTLGLQIERAFYIGKRTSKEWAIACIPAGGSFMPPEACAEVTPKVFAKCDIAGCRPGTTTNFCSGGQHFCEKD